MMEILQIVPRLPPTISGVGDYSFLLAQELRRAHDIETRFIVGDPSRENSIENALFPGRGPLDTQAAK